MRFTAGETVKHWDDVDQRLVALNEGDSVELRDGLCKYFCEQGWGASEGCETGERVPGHVKLTPEKITQINS